MCRPYYAAVLGVSLRYGGLHVAERNLTDDQLAEMLAMARAEDRAIEKAMKGRG